MKGARVCEAHFFILEEFPLIVTYHRIADIRSFVNQFGSLERQIDTAVRAVCLENISAKGVSPVSIMKSDASIERHPVFYR